MESRLRFRWPLLAAAAAFAATAEHASAQCTTGGPGGAYPAAGAVTGTWDSTLPTGALVSSLSVTVPGGATSIKAITLNGLKHTWSGDTHVVLKAPGGASYNLVVLSDSTSSGGAGCADDLDGTYIIVDAVTGSGAASPKTFNCSGVTCASDYYYQTFSTWTSGNGGIANTPLESIPLASGTWTLSLYDWYPPADNGTLTSWDLCFTLPPPPPPPPPPPSACNGPSLQTLFATNNGGNNGGQVFFDINVTNASGIDVSQIDINSDELVGTNYTMSVYTCAGSYAANTSNSGAWTLRASGNGIVAAVNTPSVTEFPDFHLAPGTYGMSLILGSTAGFSYTNGTGANQNYSNADFALSLGGAQNVAWTSPLFSPRVFNGAIRYNCVYAPPSYCTAGTSTNGCVPSISANNQPSVSFANPCVITVANVEGQKSGIVFYGINNSGFTPTPWSATSTSFLCVKAPTQRMTTTSSGGTINQCNGTLVQDWNAFQMANPTSLGNPFAVGSKAYAQGWYRDPPAPKTTNLTNAVEMTLAP